METITRIHIGRVPYDIEVAAQTKLEHYLHAVRSGLDKDTAEEVMNDIELRMTELLAERKVLADGVITAADVAFIEKQLGEPDQFADEQKDTSEPSPGHPRRLLRDMDNALVGGVASGLGAYFSIDPLIFRLLFVILTIFAFGAGILLYGLFWILMPPASSSADKLQMRGKAVTAASLQHYRQTMSRTLRWSRTTAGKIILRTLKIGTTIVAVLALLAIALSAAVATSVLFTQPLRPLVWSYHTNAFGLAAIWLFALSLITLLVILVRQIWRHKFTTAMRFTFLGALATAVIAITTIAGLAPVIANHYNDLYGNDKTTTALPVTVTTPQTNLSKLSITGDSNLQVTYVVSNQALHATYQATPGMHRPNITITASGDTLTVAAPDLRQVVPDCLVRTVCNDIYLPVKVTLYGPASIQNVSSTNGAHVTVSNMGDLNATLTVTAADGTVFTLDNDTLHQLTLNVSSGATVFASSTTAQTTTVTADKTSTVFAPVTNVLNTTVPNGACDPNEIPAPIIYLSNTPPTITVNGVTAQSNSEGTIRDIGNTCPDPGNTVN